MKISILAKDYGYLGEQLSDYLAKRKIYAEFSDPDFLVLMPTQENSDEDISALREALITLNKKDKISLSPPAFTMPQRVMSVRDAILSAEERLPVRECVGRTMSMVTVGCPPAVPIAVCGERIDENLIKIFEYYGIHSCSVVK